MTLEPTSASNEYTVVVATRQDGSFLMVHHKKRGWELPGGKLADNEGPVHCALREFREETGHLLSEPKFVLKLKQPNGTCFVFSGHLGVAVDGGRASGDVIDGMEWFDKLPTELAFPDDPYQEIGQALGIAFGHEAKS